MLNKSNVVDLSIKRQEQESAAMEALIGWQSMSGDEGTVHMFLRRNGNMVISVCGLCVPESSVSPFEENDVRCSHCSAIRK